MAEKIVCYMKGLRLKSSKIYLRICRTILGQIEAVFDSIRPFQTVFSRVKAVLDRIRPF